MILGGSFFCEEYEGNSPSASQLDGGKQCPDTAQYVQVYSAQCTKIASRTPHGFHPGLPTSQSRVCCSHNQLCNAANEGLYNMRTTRMDHHILELHGLTCFVTAYQLKSECISSPCQRDLWMYVSVVWVRGWHQLGDQTYRW